MKKILYLLLISSPIFAMQPNHATTNKLQEKLIKHENKRFTYTQAAVAYVTMPSIIVTPIPTPWTLTYVAGNIVIISAAILADKMTQNMDNNK